MLHLKAREQLAVWDGGACCHENTEESVEAGVCLPSLDGIAGGLCVDIAKINWILVI